MIHLNIKEYCKNCTNFEPETSTFEAGTTGSVEVHTMVYCAKRDICMGIYEHIKAQMVDKEQDNETI